MYEKKGFLLFNLRNYVKFPKSHTFCCPPQKKKKKKKNKNTGFQRQQNVAEKNHVVAHPNPHCSEKKEIKSESDGEQERQRGL